MSSDADSLWIAPDLFMFLSWRISADALLIDYDCSREMCETIDAGLTEMRQRTLHECPARLS
jgi:hypothetical protein